ncbi:MAG: DUF5009 domain-containing protein [Acidobacteria bacterium]|nr:DUF5009 domain-containing protein [Acidobacteriota bacterium]
MALMILVNTPGNDRTTYWPLQHAQWDGWTPTDVVFPSFLWIVGVAMTLSLGRRLAAGASRMSLFLQALRRAAIIFTLGLIVYAYPNFNLSTQRLLGVLQRIAICYLIAVAIFLTTGLRGQILWIGGLMTAYWMLMTLAPVPGYGPGNLSVEGNFSHYIDRLVLGAHNYASTRTWDPEGVVSTLPAIATALFGVLAGRLLATAKSLAEKTTWMFFYGNLLIFGGIVVSAWLPINKKLWSDSFSLFMAGLDFVLLAMFLWLVDGLGYKRIVRPFVILGMNAIVVYMASELIEEVFDAVKMTSGGKLVNLHEWLYVTVFQPLASPMNASLMYAVAYVLSMFLIAWVMYRRGWFVRI